MFRSSKSAAGGGVARRITFIGAAVLLAVIGTISAVMTVMLAKRAQERTVSWVDAKVEAVAQALDAYDQTAKLLVERFFKVFGDQFGKNFALDEANGKIMQRRDGEEHAVLQRKRPGGVEQRLRRAAGGLFAGDGKRQCAGFAQVE